jgi:hypothetical protein
MPRWIVCLRPVLALLGLPSATPNETGVRSSAASNSSKRLQSHFAVGLAVQRKHVAEDQAHAQKRRTVNAVDENPAFDPVPDVKPKGTRINSEIDPRPPWLFPPQQPEPLFSIHLGHRQFPNGVRWRTESPDAVHDVFEALAPRIIGSFGVVAAYFQSGAFQGGVGCFLTGAASLVTQHDGKQIVGGCAAFQSRHDFFAKVVRGHGITSIHLDWVAANAARN